MPLVVQRAWLQWAFQFRAEADNDSGNRCFSIGIVPESLSPSRRNRYRHPPGIAIAFVPESLSASSGICTRFPQGQETVRWAAAAAANSSSLVNAVAPIRCMAERTAISVASRSRYPDLRRPLAITSNSWSSSCATSRWMASAVFFPLARTYPQPGVPGRYFHSLPVTPD